MVDFAFYDSWWGKPPKRCTCGRRLSRVQVGMEIIHYTCPEHNLRVISYKEQKRNGIVDWRYYRLAYPSICEHSMQLSLFD